MWEVSTRCRAQDDSGFIPPVKASSLLPKNSLYIREWGWRKQRRRGREWRRSENINLCLMVKTSQGRFPGSHGIVEKRGDPVPQSSLNSLWEGCRPEVGVCGGERRSLSQLLFGSVLKAGSGATWEKLVSSPHCHSSFWIHFNVAGDYIFHQTWIWMALGSFPNILPQPLKPRISNIEAIIIV